MSDDLKTTIGIPTHNGPVELQVSVGTWYIEFKNPTNGKMLNVSWMGVINSLAWADTLKVLEP